MQRHIRLPFAACFLAATTLVTGPARTAHADAATSAPNAGGVLDLLPAFDNNPKPSSGQVTFARGTDPAAPGVNITIVPGDENYPGLGVHPATGSWDLSAYGHISADVINTGTKAMQFNMRVDNGGNWQGNPWDAEGTYLKPGGETTLSVIFGYAYGHKPSYALKSNAVVQVLIFTGKSSETETFRVVSLEAGGPAGEVPPPPPFDPNAVRIVPNNGVIFGAGTGLGTGPAAAQIVAKKASGALSADNNSIDATFPGGGGDDQAVALRPGQGRWDLRSDLEVRVKLHNSGTAPATPRVQLTSNGGPTIWATAAAPLAPGADGEVDVPFENPATWVGQEIPGDKPKFGPKTGTGNQFTSDSVGSIVLASDPPDADRALSIRGITADLPDLTLPDWLGTRPPVDGQWTQTLDDEFTGDTLDPSVWSVVGPNYYDQTTHWSKDDVILGGDGLKLRYEKKTGYQNDDTTKKQTDYAAGFVQTFGKFAQRYGYFEAKMKLPSAPGLWPAFWLMPDRGKADGVWWKRTSTETDGMEFDIMEDLTRWGPNRYNIAMHWDGYAKNHKATGSDRNYVHPDKDGFITCGLLWTPGSAIYYCNGQEILRMEDPRIASVPEFIMFTLPMGGWDNNSLDDKQLPADWTIKYVKVWQRNDLAEPGDGKQQFDDDSIKNGG